MSGLETSLRNISERNQKTRAAFQKMSARVTTITLSGTMEELDEFNGSLEAELDRLLNEKGEDPTTGSTDGSARHQSESSGEPSQ